MARGEVRVGCSGYNYKDWRGPVYPEKLPQRHWLEHYATLFDTVELNTTFYRLPAAETVEQWARQVPPGFVFAAKLGQFGSHRMKLRDAASWLPNHLDRVERLGACLGPTLVQLPPRWRVNVERLEEFFAAAPSRVLWAVELREPSWVCDEVFDVLRRHNAALCIHDLLPDHPWELTTDWTYLRFHGPKALEAKYWGEYGADLLEPTAALLRKWIRKGINAYAYFNNDNGGAAVRDAMIFRDQVKKR